MPKPQTIHGYDSTTSQACERVLVTLLRGLGPYKSSVYLVGGLTPRYLVPAQPPDVPPHAGTTDVDVVIALPILAETEAYHTLEENLRRMGFHRSTNDEGQKLSWRWETKLESGETMILEFLAEDPGLPGGRLQPLPTKGTVSAINIPHASIVFDLHDKIEVTAELLGERGLTTETIRHANLVSFTCLKAFAFDHRAEGKDAHDLVYCLENTTMEFEDVVTAFRSAQASDRGEVVNAALSILRSRFCDGARSEGYRKDGPVAVATFEGLAEQTDEASRSDRLIRQRQASAVVSQLLNRLDGV